MVGRPRNSTGVLPPVGALSSRRRHPLTVVAIVLTVLSALLMLTTLAAGMGYSEPVNGEAPTGPGPTWPFILAYIGIGILVAAGICFRAGRRR